MREGFWGCPYSYFEKMVDYFDSCDIDVNVKYCIEKAEVLLTGYLHES